MNCTEIIMEELKSCPFCGGNEIYLNKRFFDEEWSAWCYQCSANVLKHTKEDAIAAWNTRASKE